ncbi:MAG: penicillin-binding protein [Alphaproteobacteria bacterium]|nr:penicillin-binding protein [Alphaproteobacteria bacterium]
MVKKQSKKQRKKSKTKSKKALINKKVKLFLKLSGIFLGLFLLYLGFCVITIPDMDKAINRTRLPATTILAENGNEVQSFGTVYSDIIRSEELPQHIVDAIVYTEDRRFYKHFGFDIISFTRAMITNIFAGRYAQGGSTITQQVAKNLFLTNKKNINRKVQELILSFWLEHKFNKEQILTLYLNRVYFGNGAYGIEAASQKYFQKTSQDLNILEGAVLAGMLKAPSRYNPIASKEKALERAKIVLGIMLENNLLTKEDFDRALKMPLGREKNSKVKQGTYFASWALDEIKSYIGEQETDIYALTTLNQDLQEKASQILRQEVLEAKDANVNNGAVVILDKTGAVKALVGGIDYSESQFNRATQALRQPGSAFKTFVYLEAFRQGMMPEDIIEDKPLKIKDWQPENHDGEYYGDVTLRNAFAKSLNVATVRLAREIGIKNVIKTAQKAGLTTPIENDLSIALGTSSVKLIDMAAAYTSVANGGYSVWPYTIEEVYTKDGYQIYQRNKSENIRIFSEEETIKMKKLLREVMKTGTGRYIKIGREIFGKTGTTQDNRDAWFVGFDNEYICVVWVGNDDNSPMKGVYGSGLPARIWQKIMR